MTQRDEFGDKIITPADPEWDQTTVTIELTPEELHWCILIGKRYQHLVETNSAHRVDAQMTAMDVAVTHGNGCPLKLRALFEAPAQELYDDVSGIVRTLYRRTGKLRGFNPKYAVMRGN